MKGKESKFMKHGPAMLFGLVVAIVFTFMLFSFQVRTNEYAVITTFGKITNVIDGRAEGGAGLHFRWPYPIQSKQILSNRIYCFTGNVGKLEETLTKDGKNIIVGIYTMYRIADPVTFVKKVSNGIFGAEELLNSTMVNVKNGVLGSHNFDELINTDMKKMNLEKIQAEMKDEISKIALKSYGLEVTSVGINKINVPETITEKVFERMKKEREKFAASYRSEGKKNAAIIKSNADSLRRKMLAEAQAKAKEIMAEGDAEAAKYYAVFQQQPELAKFLKKLSSLEKVMKSDTTLILDTNTPPFDLLKKDAPTLRKSK